ncbi:MAG: hypothetical protein ACE369_19430 [Roseovarius sp.]
MPETDKRVMAGLIFQGQCRIDLLDAVTHAADTLKQLGQKVRSLGFLSELDAGVESDRMRVCMTLCENIELPAFGGTADVLLRITVSRARNAPEDTPASLSLDAVLARVAIDLSDHLRPTHLQWIEDDAILSAEEIAFAKTASLPADPALVAVDTQSDKHDAQIRKARAALTGIDDLHDVLDDRLERTPPPDNAVFAYSAVSSDNLEDGIIDEFPAATASQIETITDGNDTMRLSAWLLSIAVACIALPIGVALVIINLVKGENLRLVSQTAALSGLFVSFQANGATATALQAVQDLLT